MSSAPKEHNICSPAQGAGEWETPQIVTLKGWNSLQECPIFNYLFPLFVFVFYCIHSEFLFIEIWGLDFVVLGASILRRPLKSHPEFNRKQRKRASMRLATADSINQAAHFADMLGIGAAAAAQDTNSRAQQFSHFLSHILRRFFVNQQTVA